MVERHGPSFGEELTAARDRLQDAGCTVPAVEARVRFRWVREVVSTAVERPKERPRTFSDRVDRILTHRIGGTIIFLLLMFLVFQGIYVVAEPLMDQIDDWTSAIAERVRGWFAPGPLQSLLADGIVTGVGGIIKFLPQILILFGFIAILEDCGYMARAAFLMDRLMSRCGLSGKSFIPMLSSVACAVPGIMATRVIENRRDRLATMVVAPLMSCSARLPVYALLIGAFLTEGFAWYVPGLTLFSIYMIGFVVAPLVALALRRTVLRGDRGVFIMELPMYRRPSLRAIIRRMARAGGEFLRRAGTLILASMIVVWALLYYPTHNVTGESYPTRIAALEEGEARNSLEAEWRANSYLGRMGRTLEPVFQPLGWDWKLGMAALASFPAREVIVGTLGILYEQGAVDAGDDEQRNQLGEKVRADWATDPVRGRYGIAVALSVMVFFALCLQCVSTLAVIRRESRSWRWPIFTFVYMTALAYLGALLTFQVGRWITDCLS
jgi:ferrous iron transport protein B